MIKILKQGKKIFTTFLGSCSNCGCQVEAEKDELNIIRTTDQRDPPYAYIPCPNCGHQIYMTAKKS